MTTGAPETLLCDLRCPDTDDMSYWGRLEVLGVDSYGYEDGVGSQADNFDCDESRDYEEWCDWNDAEATEGYYHPDYLYEEGRFVYFKDAFGPDVDPVVISPEVRAVEQAEIRSLELPICCGDFVSGPQDVSVPSGDSVDDVFRPDIDLVILSLVVCVEEQAEIPPSELLYGCCVSTLRPRECFCYALE